MAASRLEKGRKDTGSPAAPAGNGREGGSAGWRLVGDALEGHGGGAAARRLGGTEEGRRCGAREERRRGGGRCSGGTEGRRRGAWDSGGTEGRRPAASARDWGGTEEALGRIPG
jgi:hypothetical protein